MERTQEMIDVNALAVQAGGPDATDVAPFNTPIWYWPPHLAYAPPDSGTPFAVPGVVLGHEAGPPGPNGKSIGLGPRIRVMYFDGTRTVDEWVPREPAPAPTRGRWWPIPRPWMDGAVSVQLTASQAAAVIDLIEGSLPDVGHRLQRELSEAAVLMREACVAALRAECDHRDDYGPTTVDGRTCMLCGTDLGVG